MGFKLEVNLESKPLEIPVQERLLPIGTTINLVQKINKTFGIGDIDSASLSSSLNREDSSEKDQVHCIHIMYLLRTIIIISNRLKNISWFFAHNINNLLQKLRVEYTYPELSVIDT